MSILFLYDDFQLVFCLDACTHNSIIPFSQIGGKFTDESYYYDDTDTNQLVGQIPSEIAAASNLEIVNLCEWCWNKYYSSITFSNTLA